MDSFRVNSGSNYSHVHLEFKRGDRCERSNFFELVEGDNDVTIGYTVNMLSVFFEKKDSKPLEYQEKLCSFRMFGTTSNGVEVLLGEKTFDVCLYANRVFHKLEIPLTEGKL